jgi:imidazolonepropionase-like amidohydrolase
VSGPEEVRRTVRQLIKYGVDSIKLNLSGEAITGMGAEETPMSEEEVAMACKEARARNKVIAAHARSSESVKQCIRHGIQNIFHASFADEEALDMLEAAKDKHFVAPGLAWLIQTARGAEKWGIKPGSPLSLEYERELEAAVISAAFVSALAVTMVLLGRHRAPTPRTLNISLTWSACHPWKPSWRAPSLVARSWAWEMS